MTEASDNGIRSLTEAVADLPSGPKLITALKKTSGTETAPIDLITAVVIEARAQGSAANATAVPSRIDLAQAASRVNQLQFITPRGKQDLGFFTDRLVIKNARVDVVVPYSAIENLIILDSIPKDTKGRVLLYLHLNSSSKVMNGKKEIAAVVIQVLTTQEISMAHPSKENEAQLEGSAAVVLCQAMGAALAPRNIFAVPDADTFTSADGHAGVEATVKVSAGTLFPIPAGFCFLETPALFIPIGAIARVELARATGVSSTFDLYVHCKDGSTREFSQISRLEIGAIEGYIRATGLAVGPPPGSESDVEENENEEEGRQREGDGVGAVESDSDDPDDEDFNPLPKKKKQKQENKVEKEDNEEDAEVVAVEEEEDDDDSDDDSDDSDSDGSVEMVSEDEFSMGQFKNMVEKEKGGGGGA